LITSEIKELGLTRFLLTLCLLLIAYSFTTTGFAEESPLTIVVMDPLAAPLSCPCVQGHALRHYEKLGEYLEKQLERPVKVLFADDLSKVVRGKVGKNIDLIIGKQSKVKYDAETVELPIRELAMLTDKNGKTTLTGMFVVLDNSPAQKLEDLKGYTVLFGLPDSDEKFNAAVDAVTKAGIEMPKVLECRPGCSDSVEEMREYWEKPTVAVISSYAASLLEPNKNSRKIAIRSVGETQPLPFITVFAAHSMDNTTGVKIQKALFAVKDHDDLLAALETKLGVFPMPEENADVKPRMEFSGGFKFRMRKHNCRFFGGFRYRKCLTNFGTDMATESL
jgi:ABC-type phosphate/phosphonate transport system substrate-binding protein